VGDGGPTNPGANSGQVLAALRGTIHKLVRKRQNRRSLSKKISWALYRKKQLDRLLEDIHDLVNGLVSVFPAERLKRIVKADVEEIGDAT
jgi:hypothetical protein